MASTTPSKHALLNRNLTIAVSLTTFSCHKLGRILLATFPMPTSNTRYLVSLVLESTCRYFQEEEKPLIDDHHLREIAEFSDSVMALAARLEVDLRNERWTGQKLEDVRMMYTRIIFKFTNFLLDNTSGDPQVMIDGLTSSLHSAQTYLSTTDAMVLWNDVVYTAKHWEIWYAHSTTMPSPEDPTKLEKMMLKLSSGWRNVMKGSGRGKRVGKRVEKKVG
ncbi:hypothetical protein CTheo_8835 [Ceratobasidium theobromae]|uniref:Uncharacterized protein n=1 Tax=Ceratobasidium theobromae TaxID=1582974 RepID=A0A5N5Q7S8_9AGAM|nr:hypothetical protein CTheo_8835 [Ceratobasidium theobromae]